MSGFTAVRQVDPHLKAQGGFNVRHGYCVSLLLPKRAMGEGSVRQAHTHRVEQEHLGASAELSQHCHCHRSALLTTGSGDSNTATAQQLQHLCQRWLTHLQQGPQEYRRDVCFEKRHGSICLDMFKDSETSL